MPFLRRRGVMASESDMRRHTTLFGPKSPSDLLLNSQSADCRTENGHRGPHVVRDAETAQDSRGSRDIDDSASTRASQDPHDRPESPTVQEETANHRRFSMLRFRNASDSQLSARWKQQQQAEKPPPMPEPPAIITTAPTLRTLGNTANKKSGIRNPLRIRRSSDMPRHHQEPGTGSRLRVLSGGKKNKAEDQSAHSTPAKQAEHPQASPLSAASVASEAQSATLALPRNRLSESSRSESGSADHTVHSQHTASTSSMFRFGRRKQKQPTPLFPLAHLPQRGKTPGATTAGSSGPSLPRNSTSTTRASSGHDGPTAMASPGHNIENLTNSKGAGSPATALFRPNSRNSGQSSPTRMHLGLRGRSSTMSSLSEGFSEPQHPSMPRMSSSIGRKSFGDLLGLGRLRHNTDSGRHGTLTPTTPASGASKDNSLQLAREEVALPERRDDDTPAKYLARVEGVLPRGVIASALSKETGPFYAAVLRSYMRTFSFFEEPMDMAIRKLLMEAELPKETQQIDRCLQAFANRYHECNPGIYPTPDQAYFIAFSLLILHTDVFNKNNKYKMQKADYLKNTRVEGICDDILECFYDNISYTPFIHMEDDVISTGERAASLRLKKKSAFATAMAEPTKLARDLIDPYTLILDGKLDILRPPLREQVPLEEHYSYLGTINRLNLKELQRTFFKTGVLQIVSARSRPDAFMTEKTQNNPNAAHPGIVDIKVTKVGLLWRKDTTRRRTRSPWQEWGAILTGAQLYFFRNTAWVKSLVHQHEGHVKSGHDGEPLIFKPPLEEFKPDALMSTEGAVALWDSNYKKHKNAFVYVRHGGLEEVLLAQSEEDRNDWLAKLNYAAAFKTSRVKMRGVVGGNYEGQNRRAIRRLDSTGVTQRIQTPTGEVAINRSKIDHQMARDIVLARRRAMKQKIEEAEDKLEAAQKYLDTQLRNARHMLLLAPIQERTREQVCNGAAKVIAQLRWSRVEFWRLKCHRDILAMDLAEDQEANGGIAEESPTRPTPRPTTPPQGRKGSLGVVAHPPPPSSRHSQEPDAASPSHEALHTSRSNASMPAPEDTPQSRLSHASPPDRPSSSSVVSPSKSGNMALSVPGPEPDDLHGSSDTEDAQDAHERHVLEQAGLLELERARTGDRRRSSSAYAGDDTPERGQRGSLTGMDRDHGKVRRSLQRTLRDGPGHLAHNHSKKGKESAVGGPNGTASEKSIRDEVLFRGTGSFTVHGKKASVINFGNELQGMASDEQMRTRKQAQSGDELEPKSPTNTDDDFHSIINRIPEHSGRRDSVTSASTATARSFRDLHRKYSSARTSKAAGGSNLVVPSDDDSDAAISFSDGRRSPLPPLDDEDENATLDTPLQRQFYTPEPPGSPVPHQETPDTGIEKGEKVDKQGEKTELESNGLLPSTAQGTQA
ncbi:hypothetical protein F5Y17DRAFT_420765 [Xylariaceae sp. FL0594]|nr:hypothetical protein F5Y17DRAFT_420765 [Xylariaceae sp. FL0594]